MGLFIRFFYWESSCIQKQTFGWNQFKNIVETFLRKFKRLRKLLTKFEKKYIKVLKHLFKNAYKKIHIVSQEKDQEEMQTFPNNM